MDPTIQRIVPGAIAPPRVEPPTDRQGGGQGFAEVLDPEHEGEADPQEDTSARGDRSVSSPDEDEAGTRLDITG